MKNLYPEVSLAASRLLTHRYSTSFSLGTRLLDRETRNAIYAIYGFVRLADEIVDTFQGYDQAALLADFERETYDSIARGLSLNPILQAFQHVANRYHIRGHYIDAFFASMEMDLLKQQYDREKFDQYIVGSAEVVGLMCLQVFCRGDENMFAQLEAPARRLGAAFQKINFLRDINADFVELGRTYFPNLDLRHFDENAKAVIEAEIGEDFRQALLGIRKLPRGCRLGVYVAYVYYVALFRKIRDKRPADLLEGRVRIPNHNKIMLMLTSYLRFQLRMV